MASWTMDLFKKMNAGERTAPDDSSKVGGIMSDFEDDEEEIGCFGRLGGRKPKVDLYGGSRLQAVDPLVLARRRIEDRAALAKRGMMPISSYATDTGVVPGPGTVYFSHLHHGMHKELRPEDRVLNLTGSLAGIPPASTPLALSSQQPPNLLSLGVNAFAAARAAFLCLFGSED
ncbi:hypothetical protein BKA70DRAFT_1446626 [Coprinopsis sp. MPI-PUGE-AT-0042]|nr:hypothetical protein BKA70DRAFT_1446626 [Coprinopsis sp. MPI-PUGE-AT-0042]